MFNEEASLYLDDLKESCQKAANHLKNEYANIKAGRANPKILDKVLVDYYGTPTPVTQMGTVSVPEARVLAISVWDQSALKDIVKAITASDIGINPIDDGKVIRLIFPILTEERRKEIVKQIKKMAEESKVVVRNHRRDCLDEMKKLEKNKIISEDDYEMIEKEVQKVVDATGISIDKITVDKEKEVLSV